MGALQLLGSPGRCRTRSSASCSASSRSTPLGSTAARSCSTAARGVTRGLRLLKRTAMTVGFVTLATKPVEGRLLAHERHHIRQYMLLGPLFIPVYLAIGIRYGYRRHPWETAGRRAAGEE